MDAIIFKIEFHEKPLNVFSLSKVLNEHLFNEDENEGYADIIIESKGIISGIIVNKIPTLLNIFDLDQQAIIKKEEIIIKKINFSIDISNNIFEVFTNSMRDAKRAYLTFSHTFKGKAKINQYDIPITETLLNIKESFINIEFARLNIKNFKLENYAEGYFEIKNIKSTYAWELIEIYKNSIIKSTIIIESSNDFFTLSISENGKLKITAKDKSKANHFFELLKVEIFKNN